MRLRVSPAYGALMTRLALTIATILIASALTACGESDEQKAQTTVCDARADISKQVDALKGLTPATFSTDAVSQSLRAIRTDLSEIKGAQGDLSDDRRREVESANQAFTSQVEGIVKQIGSSVTASDAASTITSAFQQLGSSYEQTFARIDCG
jgi:hypothetical protein